MNKQELKDVSLLLSAFCFTLLWLISINLSKTNGAFIETGVFFGWMWALYFVVGNILNLNNKEVK